MNALKTLINKFIIPDKKTGIWAAITLAGKAKPDRTIFNDIVQKIIIAFKTGIIGTHHRAYQLGIDRIGIAFDDAIGKGVLSGVAIKFYDLTIF
ncbi:MAG: hypothetical protein BWY70_02058 [Bacteroidetes bacterium ADurb.Bin408]|nr:MAG: hypothetical protein BWY70_02058 [Bacteroidetes bacterium ADurb.Bin408]